MIEAPARPDSICGEQAMMVECPHCHTKVWPQPDGTCPACRKNTQDKRGTDPSKTTMSVAYGEELPGLCCHCGRQTSRYFRVVRSITRTDNEAAGAGIVVASIRGLVAGLLGWWLSRSRDLVIVELPQCDPCAAAEGPPSPRHVDFGRQRMTFVVHRNLKDAATAQSLDVN